MQMTFKSILKFLEERIKEIIEYENEVLETHQEIQATGKIAKLEKTLFEINNMTTMTNNVLTTIKDLVKIKNTLTNGDEKAINLRVEKYMDALVVDFVNNGDLYSRKHALFGYSPFTDKLIKYYSENEEYEKCQELINIIENTDL